MRKKLQIIWIDDNPGRAEGATTMAQLLKAKVEFKDIKDKDLVKVLDAMIAKQEPDLIIIDHNLEDADSGIFKKGSTAAAYIREVWPECPIICVSAVEIGQVDTQQKNLYEAFISIEEISDHYNQIKSIAMAYRLAKESRPRTINEILNLLDAPEIDRIKLASIMPTQLKENLEDTSIIVEIARWVNGTLLQRPGFIYDNLRVGTLLGLNCDGFEKIKKRFKSAKYTGLFENDSHEKWWKSQVLITLSELTDASGLPWEIGRTLKGLTEDDFSRCYASDEDYPETVAFVDQSKTANEEAMKLKYTTVHPDFESLLYFDDIRLMKPAE